MHTYFTVVRPDPHGIHGNSPASAGGNFRAVPVGGPTVAVGGPERHEMGTPTTHTDHPITRHGGPVPDAR